MNMLKSCNKLHPSYILALFCLLTNIRKLGAIKYDLHSKNETKHAFYFPFDYSYSF